MTDRRRIDIRIPLLARVEGEGALDLSVRDGQIADLKLRIFEPPRFFEKFLEGRPYQEVPDIVARICGICPVAYQMSACHAIEQAFGMAISPWVRTMRRLYYCGEWIESHALHIHLLAAPDFFGFESVTRMAERYPDEVRRGLRLQAVGNRIVRLFGGRSVHPVGARVGGFYHAPEPSTVAALLQELQAALPDAEALVRWVAAFDVPDDEQDFVSVALKHSSEIAFNEGRLASSDGLDIDIREYQDHFKESQVPHSTALYSYLHGRPYLVGPLARLNLNAEQLPEQVRDNLAATGIRFPSRNMFHSALARAVEIHYALVEAIRLCREYEVPEQQQPYAEAAPRSGTGYGCTEAPRGILWHRYETDEEGRIVSAVIIPPTSQNQARIEEDLHHSLQAFGLDEPDDALRLRGEMVIRNYDPCISCSVHFLRLKVDRE